MPIPRRFCVAAAPLALCWLGCVSPDSLNESNGSLETPACASAWVCGSNSPEVDHYGFHELNLQGLPNTAGIRISSSGGAAQLTKGIKVYTLHVKEAKIVGLIDGRVALSGVGLVGAEIHLFIGTRADYTIRIEAVHTVPFPVGNTTELAETYTLSWYNAKLPPDGKRNICRPPTILTDPAQTGVVIVSAPEEMPVAETIDLARRLDAETDVDLAAIVVNRVLPELFTEREEALFEQLRDPARVAALSKAAGGDVQPILDAAELAVTLRRTRAGHLADLRAAVDPRLPLIYVPYLFARSHGARATRQVAEFLGEEL